MTRNVLNKLLLSSLALTASLAWTDAFASRANFPKYCIQRSPHPTEKFVTLPPRITLDAAPVGGVLATITIPTGWTENDRFWCYGGPLIMVEVEGLNLIKKDDFFETNIPGIALRTGLTFTADTYVVYAPRGVYPVGSNDYSVRTLTIQLVRTDTSVSSGTLPTNFKVKLSTRGDPTLQYTVTVGGNSEVISELFSSCSAVNAVVDVQMGKESIENLTSGRATERPFNFDVRCEGLKPTTPPPVRVYFEGNSSADGMLALSGAGTPGVASGIGISLVDNKGVKLPFAKARQIKIDHLRSEPQGEVYRFSGTAKYALTSGQVKPGKANATMTYVIEYN
ncbi:fimbrial protein [Pseudomonas sp. Q1-7]|uniref:fimbrial protein n=1 Tax=Pseudomonas sp. Q1-7 TaxID=3020843 RepID=UPI0023011983|nr:fimbrial protein [Pseudomonas sp. Q1-7]